MEYLLTKFERPDITCNIDQQYIIFLCLYLKKQYKLFVIMNKFLIFL